MKRLLLLLTLVPLSAEAYMPGPCETDYLAPKAGVDGVPTNAKVWVGWDSPWPPREVYRLVDADGNEVPTTMTHLQGGSFSVLVFAPDSPLQPNRSYVFERQDAEEWTGITAFFTGDGPSEEAVEAPKVTSSEELGFETEIALLGQMSSDQEGVEFQLDGAKHVTVFSVGPEPQGSPTTEAGGLLLGEVTEVFVGNEGCGSVYWTNFDADTLRLWIGAFDVAGNFSGWSPVEVPFSGPGIVQKVGPMNALIAAGVLAVVVLLLLVVLVLRLVRTKPDVYRT